MLENEFVAAMTDEGFWKGEARHQQGDKSRKLALTAGLTKSSEELKKAWDENPELFLVALSGALAAYDENESVKELLVSSISRLASVVDTDGEVEMAKSIVSRAMEIIGEDSDADQ